MIRVAPALVLFCLLSPAAGSAQRWEPDPGDTSYVPRYLFAIEDTMNIPAQFRMGPVEVKGERLGIGEIVERCIEGEEAARERIETDTYTQLVKTVLHLRSPEGEPERLRVMEDVQRVFYRKGEGERTMLLKHEEYSLEDGVRGEWNRDEDRGRVDVRYSEFNDLPFYLEDKDQYDFEILSRRIMEGRVIYEVRLTPKSDFEIAPEGRIWIETSDFRILREEFDFGERVPMPFFVKSIGPFIRERESIGDLWVWRRFLIRVELRAGWIPFLGKDLPEVIEYHMSFHDHVLNGEPAGGSSP